MGIEVVLDQDDLLGVGIVDIDQVLDALGPVDPGAAVADHDLAPARRGLADQEQVDHALAHTRSLPAPGTPGAIGNGRVASASSWRLVSSRQSCGYFLDHAGRV